MRRHRIALAILPLLVIDLGAQGAALTRRLPTPQVAFTTELTSVNAVRELSDERVVVVDGRERMLLLFDPRTREGTRISRDGAGPGEYSRPSLLLALPADSTLVADFGNNRFLVLGAAGEPIGTMPLLQLQPSAGVTYGLTVRQVDGTGGLYYDLPRGLITVPEKGTPILRHDRSRQRSDTVGVIKDFTPAPVRTAGQGGVGMGGMAPTPFAPRDEWAVASDGSVAFVRAEPYRVEWVSAAGALVVGPVIAYERVPVNEAEKDAWRAESRARGGPTVTTTDVSGRTTSRTVPVPDPAEWPAFKAPFGAGAARVAPDGRLWVHRALAANATESVYDIFDRSGRVVERITMPIASRVVGFGRRSVYTVRKDEDDLLYLERHALDY